jgi:parallel beta helix pectate lyase-like protein
MPASSWSATNVIIDGFTIQNANNAANANDSAIDLKGNGGGLTPANGAKILNNILQNNGQAVSLNFEGVGPVSNVLIEHNLFRNNNVVSGDGIFTSACQNVNITENSFTGDPTAAIGINNSSNVTITYNQSSNDGTFVIFTNTTNSEFSNNRGSNFVAPGAAFPGTGGAAVSIGPSNSFLTISDNDLEKGNGGIDGIRFWLFGATPGTGIGPSQNLTVSDNSIQGMSLAGIVAEAIAGGSSLSNSLILRNDVHENGGDGILMDTGNTGNLLTQNEADEDMIFDCHDNSSGSGTLGTGNTWFNDAGKTSSPTGLCSPENNEGDDNGQGDDNHGGNNNQQGQGSNGNQGRGGHKGRNGGNQGNQN